MSGVSTLKVVKHKLTIAGKVVHTLNGGRQGPPGPAGPAVAGSDKQVIFNDGGVSGGDSGLSYDKTTGVLTVGGKTVTTSAPALQVAQTWNAGAVAFTGLQLNVTDTASAAASRIFDFKVGGASKVYAEKSGRLFAQDFYTAGSSWSILNSGVASLFSVNISAAGSFYWSTGDLALFRGGAGILEQRNGANGQLFEIFDNYIDASNKSFLKLGWGGTTHQVLAGNVGSTSAQSLQVGTLGSASLLLVTAGTNRWQVTNQGHLQASTDNVNDIGFNGTLRPRTGYFGTSIVTPSVTSGGVGTALALGGAGTDQWRISGGLVYPTTHNAYDFGTAGNAARTGYFGTSVVAPTHQTTDTTVASLPAASASTRGQRRHVTDSTVAAAGNFGAAVAGGGSNVVPVYCTGAAWIIA